MLEKPKIPTEEDLAFRELLQEILTEQEPVERLLEHPLFKRRLALISRTLTQGDTQEADELYEEVQIKVWRKVLVRFKPDYDKPYGKFFAWVRKIAQRTRCDHFRRNALPLHDARPEDLLELKDPNVNVELEFEQSDIAARLRKHTSELSVERDRKATELYLQGFSYREIADQ